jgi:hypothetical protein
MPPQNDKAEIANVDKPAGVGPANDQAGKRPSKRRLKRLATLWAKQTGRKVVVR